MPNSATIYLPVSTWVNVQAFTNASYTQRVTIAPESQSAFPTKVLTGTGEHNTPMSGGTFGFTTPSTSQRPLGFSVTVTVESADGSGRFRPSQVLQGSCSVMYFTAALVVSEDYVDDDWNDAVVQFSWWVPPGLRNSQDLHIDAER